MTADLMQEALRATARVACCAALIGCGPAKAPPAQTPATQATTTPAEAPTDATESTTSAEPTLETCREHVAQTLGQDKRGTDETKACCVTIAEHYNKQHLEGMQQWTERMACCELLDWSRGGLACTPWGPPVPPAMPSALA